MDLAKQTDCGEAQTNTSKETEQKPVDPQAPLCSPHPQLKMPILTARASPDDELSDFIIHEDEKRVGEGTEPPGRSGNRIK